MPPYTHSAFTVASGDGAAALNAHVENSGIAPAHSTHNVPLVNAGNNELSEQQQQQHLHPGQVPLENTAARLWFFRQGEYYPKPAHATPTRTGQGKRGDVGGAGGSLLRGKKHDPRGAGLFPYQNPHSDRIVNQLMYVPPNYEKVRASGRMKIILLYNGLGPWNVKQGNRIADM